MHNFRALENILAKAEKAVLKLRIMKKKTIGWMTALLMALAAILTSCEKFALDESNAKSHDANCNVTIHASVAKKSRTIAPNSQAAATRSDDGNSNVVKPLEDYCSRLSIAIFDGEEKVKTLNLNADEDGYGDIELYLDKGDYRMVAIGHNGSGNCTISSPEQVKFYKNKLTDTFFYYGKLKVEESDDTEETIELSRAVAQLKVHIADSVIPEKAHTIKFYYTGGSSTLNAVTGYGCVNSRQTESFKLSEDNKYYSIYTFPHEENNGVNMTISILDSDTNTLKEFTKSSLPMKCNYITTAELNLQEDSISEPTEEEQKEEGDIGFTINPEWDGEINVEFE